jgi:diacylglycerol kinase (ATP)
MPMLAEVAPARRFAVIVNRQARAAPAVPWGRVADVLRGHGVAADFSFPSSSADAVRIARAAAGRPGAVIVAAGGDGTVNTIVGAVTARNVPLAILPLGTANDLARALGIPLDVVAAADRLGAPRERAIDLIEVNGRPICTVGGFGLPAACALAVDRARRGPSLLRAVLRALGTGIYPALAATTILSGAARARRLRIAYHDPRGVPHRLAVDAAGVFVANQSSLGGTLTLPTGSDHADGVFELCIVRPMPRLRLLAVLARLKSGDPVPADAFDVRAVTRAEIACDARQPFFGDGEALGRSRRFVVRMRRRALRVLS